MCRQNRVIVPKPAEMHLTYHLKTQDSKSCDPHFSRQNLSLFFFLSHHLCTANLTEKKMAYGEEIRARKRIGGRFLDITLSFVIVTIPMFLFAGLLLGLVFRNRVTHNNPPYKHLQLEGTTDEPGIYYVNLNATFLVFIASWSSSVAPMLGSFILLLAAYPICRQYLRQAQANITRELLTPYQLTLTLRFMNGGGFGALWSWLKYHTGWKNVREPQGSVLSKTALVAILASSLGYANPFVL
jgi:hypothetical protein